MSKPPNTRSALDHVRAAIAALETALTVIAPIGDVNVCVAEGELHAALMASKEALARLEDSL